MKYDRQNIINDLKQFVVEIAFTKVNGESRVMRCTLDPRYIPGAVDPAHLDEQHAKVENKDIIAAWDLQNNGWRSFRVDSVQYVHEIDGY